MLSPSQSNEVFNNWLYHSGVCGGGGGGGGWEWGTCIFLRDYSDDIHLLALTFIILVSFCVYL